MILSLVSQKGGAGKSTLALSIAWELMARRHKVLVVDADPQGTASLVVQVAKEKGRAAPTIVGMGKDMWREDQLPAMAGAFDHVVIDTPGKLGDVQKAALMASDFVLVPIGQSAADVWSLQSTVDLIVEAKAFHPALAGAVVLTRCKPMTLLGQHASLPLQQAVEQTEMTALKGSTTNRLAWELCLGEGLGVAQYAPKDKAAAELRSVVNEVLGLAKARPAVKLTTKRKKVSNG